MREVFEPAPSKAQPEPIANMMEHRLPAKWSKGVRSILIKYLESNLIGALWSVCLLWGGMIFLVYFCSIEFIPDIDLKTLVMLLAVAAITGAFLLTALGLLLMFPAWTWIWVWEGVPESMGPIQTRLVGRSVDSPKKGQPTPESPESNVRSWLILERILLAVSSFVICSLYLLSLRLPTFWAWTILGVFLVPAFVIWGKLRKQPCKTIAIATGKFYARFLVGVFYLIVTSLLVVEIVNQNTGPHDSPIRAVLVTLLTLFFIVLLNLVLAIKQQPRDGYAVMVLRSLTVLILLLLFAPLIPVGKPFIPNAVMKIYKFGNLTNATLILDETGCAIAQRYGLTLDPDQQNNVPLAPKATSLHNATIYSRIGSPYYIGVPRSSDTCTRLTIPAQNVLSWTLNESNKTPPAKPTTGVQNPCQEAAPLKKQ